jgi:hypothetical protein
LTYDGTTLNVVNGKVITSEFSGSLQNFQYNVNTNTTNGIGIGHLAYGNDDHGIGIGYSAFNNDTYGVGLGYRSIDNTNLGVGIGAYTTSNTKGPGSVALGSYSKVQRFNEIISAANEDTANKSLSIIQKFRNVTIAANGGAAVTELFADATGERVTIQPSSLYHFSAQINAIDETNFDCKTWEITGAVKRNNANNTVLVGNSPNTVVTSYDAGAVNWNVVIDADNANESLLITVQHDSANSVRFSATIWVTETRL